MRRWPWGVLLLAVLYFAFLGFLGWQFIRLMESVHP